MALLGADHGVAKMRVQGTSYVCETSEFLDFNGCAETGDESLGL